MEGTAVVVFLDPRFRIGRQRSCYIVLSISITYWPFSEYRRHFPRLCGALSKMCSEFSWESELKILQKRPTTHCKRDLQHIATQCNILRHSATLCNISLHAATHCNTLQHTATHCNISWFEWTWHIHMRDTLQHTTTLCNTLQHTATCVATPSYMNLIHKHSHTNMYTLTNTHTQTRTHFHTHKRAQTHIHIHTRTLAHTHAHTHAHTQTHTHTSKRQTDFVTEKNI